MVKKEFLGSDFVRGVKSPIKKRRVVIPGKKKERINA